MTRTIYVCTNRRFGGKPSCAGRGSEKLLRDLRDQAIGVEVAPSPCMGHCSYGPNAKIAPGGALIRGAELTTLLAAVATKKG